MMRQHVSVITLGVRDLDRAQRFYSECLGWKVASEKDQWIAFELGEGSSALALFPWHLLAEDAGVEPHGEGFGGVTLSYGVASEGRVDELLAQASQGGGKIVKAGQPASWGGYSGYFADPEGHLWEVATINNYRAE